MTIRYRQHQGSLAASLRTTVLVDTMTELTTEVSRSCDYPLWKGDVIRFVPIDLVYSRTKDSIRWETHMVTVNGDAVGYSDGTIS